MLSNYFHVLDNLCCSFPEAINLDLMAKGQQVMGKNNSPAMEDPYYLQDNLLTTRGLVKLLYLQK